MTDSCNGSKQIKFQKQKGRTPHFNGCEGCGAANVIPSGGPSTSKGEQVSRWRKERRNELR
jgi:hypothetical protein